MTALIVIGIICALIGIPLGRWKNDWWRGMLVGLLFGPIGLGIMCLFPASEEARIRREQQRMYVQEEARRRGGAS